MMLKAYKYRIYPSTEQKRLIENHFGACRLVYNLALEIKIASYKAIGKSPSAFDLCYQLPELKEAFPWLKELDSQALQAAVKKVDVAYKNFFKGNGFPKFKKRNGHQSYQVPHEVRRIDWEKQTLTIPKIKDIPIVLSREFTGKIKTITISRTPSGKYFASILVDNNKPLPEKRPVIKNSTVGIDVGIKDFAVLSDGRTYGNPRFLKNDMARLQVLQRRISRKRKGSNNRKKAVLKLAILHEKIVNRRKDYLHKLSYRLVSESQATMFCMEGLRISNMIKNHNLAQSISDVGWSIFAGFMAYKCKWNGKTVTLIGTFQPSSKMCNKCEAINHELNLADRVWTCQNCGTVHDRDKNAADNIKEIGFKQYCNNKAGKPLPEGPVESLALAEAMKQEISVT